MGKLQNGLVTKLLFGGMVTNDKLKKAVITHLWDSDKEAKIINDYNAAQLGILTENQLPMITRNICKREKLSKK